MLVELLWAWAEIIEFEMGQQFLKLTPVNYLHKKLQRLSTIGLKSMVKNKQSAAIDWLENN